MKRITESLLAVLACSGCALCLLYSDSTHARTTAQSAPTVQARLATRSDFLSSLEQEVLNELNLARTRPSEYAAYLEQLKPLYSGRHFAPPGKGRLLTEEGFGAVEEAINFLRVTNPLPPLEIARGMCSGAGELAREQGRTGSTGHRGADGSYCEQRVARYGTYQNPIGENLTYGDDSARERVVALLIDDGVKGRGHRQRIFNASYKVAGVACGEHSQLGSMCVITLAGGFADKSPDNRTATGNAPLNTSRKHN